VVWFLLIPISYGEEVIRAEIRMAIFDACANRFVKTHWRLKMPAVMRKSRAGFPVVKFR